MAGELSDTPILTTERLTLRAPRAGDERAMMPFLQTARASWVGGGADCDTGRAWRIASVLAGHWVIRGYGSFVLETRAEGRPIGSAGPWNPGDWPEAELGWTIWSEADEGRGYAHEAMVAIRAHAYDHLGWTTAVSYIAYGNARSRALALRLGCRLDEAAAVPHPDEPTWVYRHPGPEAGR